MVVFLIFPSVVGGASDRVGQPHPKPAQVELTLRIPTMLARSRVKRKAILESQSRQENSMISVTRPLQRILSRRINPASGRLQWSVQEQHTNRFGNLNSGWGPSPTVCCRQKIKLTSQLIPCFQSHPAFFILLLFIIFSRLCSLRSSPSHPSTAVVPVALPSSLVSPSRPLFCPLRSLFFFANPWRSCTTFQPLKILDEQRLLGRSCAYKLRF